MHVHYIRLLKNTSDIPELQVDFNNYGKSAFVFRVLYIGPRWADKSIREKKEHEIISKYKPYHFS